LFIQYVEKFFLIESSLRGIIFSNIRKYRITKSYKGSRYIYGLPANGQRTKTNARTCKKFNKVKKTLNNLIKIKKVNNKSTKNVKNNKGKNIKNNQKKKNKKK
jgi:small subunit ribosomal protein S13